MCEFNSFPRTGISRLLSEFLHEENYRAKHQGLGTDEDSICKPGGVLEIHGFGMPDLIGMMGECCGVNNPNNKTKQEREGNA